MSISRNHDNAFAIPEQGGRYGAGVLFEKRVWARIEDGSVTLAFRRWRRPTVRTGGTLHSPAGLLAIDSVEPVDVSTITEAEAATAGYASVEDLRSELGVRTDGVLYRIRFHRIGEDPRIALRNDAELTSDAITEITQRLARFDAVSSRGPWTATVLDLIAGHPGRRAPDLAAEMTRRTGVLWETQPFKTDVRKLKSLGLTESLRIGYRLSPRGRAYLTAMGRD